MKLRKKLVKAFDSWLGLVETMGRFDVPPSFKKLYMKKETRFEFEIPLTEMATINQRLTAVNHGSIKVEGVARKTGESVLHDPVEFDLDSITWDGKELFDLFQFGLQDEFEKIHELAYKHALTSLIENEVEAQDYNEY